MNPEKLLLAPFALIYGSVAYIRNKLYDWNVFRSTSFPQAVVCIGNLSMGGTGKTPHVEYLIRLLDKHNTKCCTLSRGYGRKTKGFIEANKDTGYLEIGDEPSQYQAKFPNIPVYVCEKRVLGIKKIRKNNKNKKRTILLDDAFQHRSVKAGLNIMLTDYHRIYTRNYVFPMGNLREFRFGVRRADIIIITKTGPVLSPITRKMILDEIKPKPHQKVYFSFIKYNNLTPLPGISKQEYKKSINTILLLAGIANPYPLEYHLRKDCYELQTIKFPDHYQFKVQDIKMLLERFDNVFSQNKIIVTTEKDAMRLQQPEILKLLEGYPVFYVPIRIKFHDEDGNLFDQQVLDYIRSENNKPS